MIRHARVVAYTYAPTIPPPPNTLTPFPLPALFPLPLATLAQAWGNPKLTNDPSHTTTDSIVMFLLPLQWLNMHPAVISMIKSLKKSLIKSSRSISAWLPSLQVWLLPCLLLDIMLTADVLL